MHFRLEFLEYILVMEVCVRKKAVKASDDRLKMAAARLRDRNPRREVIAVVDHRCCVVQRMNHVIDRRTVLIV